MRDRSTAPRLSARCGTRVTDPRLERHRSRRERRGETVSEEIDSSIALDRVASASSIIAPDWMMIEVSHALWKKSRRSSLDENAIKAGIEALGQIVDKAVPSAALLEKAVTLAFDLSHPVYDCLYLALALEQGGTVVTADRAFFDAAWHSDHADRVELLA